MKKKSLKEMSAGELRLEWERGKTAVDRMAAYNERERRLRTMPEKIKAALRDVVELCGIQETLGMLADVSEELAHMAQDHEKATALAISADNLREVAKEVAA